MSIRPLEAQLQSLTLNAPPPAAEPQPQSAFTLVHNGQYREVTTVVDGRYETKLVPVLVKVHNHDYVPTLALPK